MQSFNISVTSDNLSDKTRVDSFLAENFEDYSRTFIQKIIKEGNVLVNDKQVKASNNKNLDEIEFENIRYSMLQQATKDEYIKDAKIYADESIKIAELAYRLKRGVDLLPVFIEDINVFGK